MPTLSPELTSLLDDDLSPEEVAVGIAACPALVAEVEAALPALKFVATAPAGEDGVKAVIGKRFALYPQPKRAPGEWAAWWESYFDTLSQVALSSLEAAMRAYVADPESEFMPKPGRLKELAFTTPSRSLQRFYRARRVLDIANTPKPGDGPKVDAAEVRKLLAEFQAKATPAARHREPMANLGGKPDEGGLTAEMRKLMAKRAEAGR